MPAPVVPQSHSQQIFAYGKKKEYMYLRSVLPQSCSPVVVHKSKIIIITIYNINKTLKTHEYTSFWNV